jgi:transcriptional regulator with XRE-family HTH domain
LAKTGPEQRRSSTMVRRQLGRRLRALREDAGKTREDVAATKLMSRSKLELMEFGRTMVRPGDVYELGVLYGAPDDVIAALRELAAATTQDGWWQEHGGNVAKAFETYLDLEVAATEINVFEPLVIYGLFQTEDYARAVERGSTPHKSETAIEGSVRVRLARQQTLLATHHPVRLRAILGEAALRLQVGGPAVMREQYDHLVALARSGVAGLRVLPFIAGSHPGGFGPFTILDFADPEDPPVVRVSPPRRRLTLAPGSPSTPLRRCRPVSDSGAADSISRPTPGRVHPIRPAQGRRDRRTDRTQERSTRYTEAGATDATIGPRPCSPNGNHDQKADPPTQEPHLSYP